MNTDLCLSAAELAAGRPSGILKNPGGPPPARLMYHKRGRPKADGRW
jgi:hypothetical protein